MYLGRIVAIGRNGAGDPGVVYRVSSRSFPNREAKILGKDIAILPKAGFEYQLNENPFIAYTCIRQISSYIVVGNGTHTDIIAAKLSNQFSMRDSLIDVLHAFDYEKDSLCTPRIAGIVNCKANVGYLGVITKSSLHVKNFELKKGSIYYLSTYEHNYPDDNFSDHSFNVTSAKEACQYIIGKGIFAEFENSVTAASAIRDNLGEITLATANAE